MWRIRRHLARDCIDGLIWSTPNLGRLDGYPDVKVVYRTDWNKDKVAVLCGGGAGHEPMHGGFVGRGMLTAAISGETFASPSIDAVLAAIVQVTGPKGCLLIIKNYTGETQLEVVQVRENVENHMKMHQMLPSSEGSLLLVVRQQWGQM
eukprot:s4923_g3.t1